MYTSSSRARVSRFGTVASAALGLLLVGAVPASADSVRSRQWHLDTMKAEQMWESSTGKNVTVAVIDTGVDATNPDLLGQVLKGLDLAPGSPGDERVDYDSHGTAMAGLIAGTGKSGGGDGAFGLAPGAKILPIRLRDDTGRVNGATGSVNFSEDVSAGIHFAVDNGAKVINISQGDEIGSREISDAVKYAIEKGSLIFAAVGNAGDKGNGLEYPAATPGVVGVGALGRNAKKTEESQHGAQVDLSAPGIDMVHPCTGGTQLCKTSGTSDATAIASASAALIWSKHPDWTNNQVLRVMLNTAGGPTSGAKRNDYVGYGAVRPRIALKTPGDPGPADVYPLPDLAAAETPSPSAKPSKATGGSEDADKPAAAAPAYDDDSSNTGLWIGLGIGAVALIGVVAAALAIRSRRRKATAAAPPAYPHQPPYPYPYQQPQPQQQPTHPAYAPPPHGDGSRN
ncbi:type VII secretion-associated serine protease mycosin [Streptomyces sp. NBC_01217]|uniref:type VII secretion-associated serine protease mycosin n=1 Tax=Streptomyces sp. NBC_01217 TaxID=2903779 RepID=UPI002E0EDB87|nr:type VII secretion-associated serine protease mycosin [Streptomyces sp. NBC_01217]